MMPELGKYAEAVLSSYAVAIVLIAGLITVSVMRSRGVAQPRLKRTETTRR